MVKTRKSQQNQTNESIKLLSQKWQQKQIADNNSIFASFRQFLVLSLSIKIDD